MPAVRSGLKSYHDWAPPNSERKVTTSSSTSTSTPVSRNSPNSPHRWWRMPKRANSKSHARYERYKQAKTVGEFYRLGGTKGDLKNDSDPNRGYIIFI